MTKMPTTVKNPQANSTLERLHDVFSFSNMLRAFELNPEMSLANPKEEISQLCTGTACAIHSSYHTTLGAMPGTAIFGCDMLFDIPFSADWSNIGRRRQQQVNKANEKENSKRVSHDYCIGDKVMLRADGYREKLHPSIVSLILLLRNIQMVPYVFNVAMCLND